MQDTNNGSGINTILIVILIILVVGFGVYWFTRQGAPAPESNGPSLDINLGGGEGSSGEGQ